MKTIVTLACLILSFGYGGLAISQDSPNDVSVDQYLLEATKAIENGDTQRALKLLSTARSKLKESDRRQAAAQPRPAKDKAFLQKVLKNLKKQMVHARAERSGWVVRVNSVIVLLTKNRSTKCR